MFKNLTFQLCKKNLDENLSKVFNIKIKIDFMVFLIKSKMLLWLHWENLIYHWQVQMKICQLNIFFRYDIDCESADLSKHVSISYISEFSCSTNAKIFYILNSLWANGCHNWTWDCLVVILEEVHLRVILIWVRWPAKYYMYKVVRWFYADIMLSCLLEDQKDDFEGQ